MKPPKIGEIWKFDYDYNKYVKVVKLDPLESLVYYEYTDGWTYDRRGIISFRTLQSFLGEYSKARNY